MFINKRTFNPRLVTNRFRLAKGFLKGDTFLSGFPLELGLEVTNRCNAECIMCARKDMKRPIGDMDFGLFKKIIAEARLYNELIWMHLAGEPLLHPKLFEMIVYAKSCGINLGLSTNAISLDEKKAREIINSGLDLLVISFDGATKETHEKIRRFSNFEKTSANIFGYLNQKKKSKNSPHTQIQCVYMEENKREADAFVRMWRNTAVESVRFKPYMKFPDLNDTQIAPQAKNYKKVKPCILLWRQCSIYWDGTVVSCCWDFLGHTPLGNIKDKPLAQIWNCEQMQHIRDKHVRGQYQDIGLCRNCKVPQIGMPYLLGSIFIDVLTVKKLLPFFDNLASVKKIKAAKYFT